MQHEQPALDPLILEQLRELGGDDLLRELFEIFVGLAPERLAALDAARRKRDYSAAALAAHSLKSAGSSIGSRSLAAVAGAVEAAANRGEADELDARSAELEEALASLVDQLERQMGEETG